jgi:hypothetical protein
MDNDQTTVNGNSIFHVNVPNIQVSQHAADRGTDQASENSHYVEDNVVKIDNILASTDVSIKSEFARKAFYMKISAFEEEHIGSCMDLHHDGCLTVNSRSFSSNSCNGIPSPSDTFEKDSGDKSSVSQEHQLKVEMFQKTKESDKSARQLSYDPGYVLDACSFISNETKNANDMSAINLQAESENSTP